LAIDVEDFYRRYGPMVLRRCQKLLRSEAQAQDAMQDVFVQVLSHEQSLDATAPAGLLLRIATNVSLNRLRSTRRRPEDADGRFSRRPSIPPPQSKPIGIGPMLHVSMR